MNLVPGNKILNNSDYKKMENELREFHNDGYIVDVQFKAVYSLGNTSSRPDGFKVEYTLENGTSRTQEFTNTGERTEK